MKLASYPYWWAGPCCITKHLPTGWHRCHQPMKGCAASLNKRPRNGVGPRCMSDCWKLIRLVLTGRALSDWHEATQGHGYQGELMQFGLYPEDRQALHRQIDQRFDAMLEQGLVDEVRRLSEEPDIHSALPSQRAVGYRQVWQYLEGSIDEARLRESGKAATRQLAKRQLTWMRSMPSLTLFDSFSLSPEAMANQIAVAVGQAAGNGE